MLIVSMLYLQLKYQFDIMGIIKNGKGTERLPIEGGGTPESVKYDIMEGTKFWCGEIWICQNFD